eukprot:NODE_4225_length_821_cov_258.661383_g4067_i0.p1 GENE.NODE_4225_length_821_cov_258.661383_g4067_i0~~NODE_4225_length_821_cov_258.661383_g4067_i0.p1  ORF type:complete len:210 (+),score=46.83 NODE_4225_length_821_cov_258.661383_g4067_i0:60-689(+)
MAKNTLYYRPGACALGVHITLEWAGGEFEVVDVPRGDVDFATNVNPPNGAVPAFKTKSGAILTQCEAIMKYVAKEAKRQDLLGGDDLLSQAQVDRWLAFMTGDLHPANFPIFMPDRYTTSKEEAALGDVKAAGFLLVRKCLATLDKHLATTGFFVGHAKTLPDALAFPMLRWAKGMGMFSDFPVVSSFYEKMAADPGVAAALKKQGIEA